MKHKFFKINYWFILSVLLSGELMELIINSIGTSNQHPGTFTVLDGIEIGAFI